MGKQARLQPGAGLVVFLHMVLEAVEERARGVDQVPGQDVYNEGKDRGQVRGILRDRREQPALQSEEKSDMNNQFQAMTVNH